MRLSRFTINTHMKLLFAGATHAGHSRVREQIVGDVDDGENEIFIYLSHCKVYK
jgi:hypothetical protein